MTFLSPGVVAVTVPIYPDVPPVTWSLVVNVPVNTTYLIVVDGELTITLPVAAVEVPVIISPTVNVPVELEIVKVGVTGVVPIAADSYTACNA